MPHHQPLQSDRGDHWRGGQQGVADVAEHNRERDDGQHHSETERLPLGSDDQLVHFNGRCGHAGDVFCILALWSGKGGRLDVDFIDADGGVRHWNEGHVHKDEGPVVILVDEHLQGLLGDGGIEDVQQENLRLAIPWHVVLRRIGQDIPKRCVRDDLLIQQSGRGFLDFIWDAGSLVNEFRDGGSRDGHRYSRGFHQENNRHGRGVVNLVDLGLEHLDLFEDGCRVIVARIFVIDVPGHVCVHQNHADLAGIEFVAVLFHLDDRKLVLRRHPKQVDVLLNVGLAHRR